MTKSFFDDMAAEAADLSTAPTEVGSARLRALGEELTRVDAEVEDLAEQLREKIARRTEILTRDMVALMQEVGQDKIGMPEAGVDLELHPFYSANIAADWESERREAGFRYLESVDAGDLIKNVVAFQFGRSQHNFVRVFLEAVRALEFEAGLVPEPTVSMSVHAGTLTAWLREQTQAGEVVDLEKIGGTVGQVVKIKKRKDKKSKKEKR